MYTVTLGDAITVMGAFGINLDYTVRLKLRLRDKIDDEILKEAVEWFRSIDRSGGLSAGAVLHPWG